ncbi:MAG: hypothetical protein J6W84_02635 [Bacteroidales bacterium]|nr:hypothetical protein [Bacteroidales bacterium]
MKKLLFLSAVLAICFTSCKTTQFGGNNAFYGQVNQTQVVLSESNFKVLGSFVGHSNTKVKLLSIKDKDGLVAGAKQDFLNNARAAGVELTGSRAIVNACVDYITNGDRITVTFSAEIIEFTK